MDKKPFRKTVVVPDEAEQVPLVAWLGGGDDWPSRDVTKPVAYDDLGRALFAPLGRIFRWPWWNHMRQTPRQARRSEAHRMGRSVNARENGFSGVFGHPEGRCTSAR
jgi:hypothetical protein